MSQWVLVCAGCGEQVETLDADFCPTAGDASPCPRCRGGRVYWVGAIRDDPPKPPRDPFAQGWGDA